MMISFYLQWIHWEQGYLLRTIDNKTVGTYGISIWIHLLPSVSVTQFQRNQNGSKLHFFELNRTIWQDFVHFEPYHNRSQYPLKITLIWNLWLYCRGHGRKKYKWYWSINVKHFFFLYAHLECHFIWGPSIINAESFFLFMDSPKIPYLF